MESVKARLNSNLYIRKYLGRVTVAQDEEIQEDCVSGAAEELRKSNRGLSNECLSRLHTIPEEQCHCLEVVLSAGDVREFSRFASDVLPKMSLETSKVFMH